MKRFYQWSPLTYKIAIKRQIIKRKVSDFLKNEKISSKKSDSLEYCIFKHSSLIRRKLGNVDLQLQENKAINLGIAAPKINTVVIEPGETFSFWKLVGKVKSSDGYLDGLIIKQGKVDKGTGGGMCQFSNLIHWMVLHTPLDIVEHHHHNQYDLFPDYKRVIPFGTGTSIVYNYLDYRFKNNTNQRFQLITYVDQDYLMGEIRSNVHLENEYKIIEEDSYFYLKDNKYYRHNKIYKVICSKGNSDYFEKEFMLENNAEVLYDSSFIEDKIKEI
jgi:vancomycin resistance protein VanW